MSNRFFSRALLAALFALLCTSVLAQFVGLELHQYAFHPDGVNDYRVQLIPDSSTTYRLYARFENSTDEIIAFGGVMDQPMIIYSSEDFFNHASFGTSLPLNLLPPDLTKLIPSLAYETWLTIDLEESGGNLNMMLLGDSETLALDRRKRKYGSVVSIDSDYGGGVFVFNSEDAPAAGDDKLILLGQFTTRGSMHFGGMFIQCLLDGNRGESQTVYVEDWNLVGIQGCGDVNACNYEPHSVPNNELCCYDGCGCMYPFAVNYSAEATCDDGSCVFQEPEPIVFNSNYLMAPAGEQFLWSYNGEPITDGNEEILEIRGAGQYQVEMVNLDGEFVTSRVFLTEKDLNWDIDESITWAIEQEESVLFLWFDERGYRTASLVAEDNSSRKMFAIRNSDYAAIDISGMPAQSYILEVVDRGETSRKVIVIE